MEEVVENRVPEKRNMITYAERVADKFESVKDLTAKQLAFFMAIIDVDSPGTYMNAVRSYMHAYPNSKLCTARAAGTVLRQRVQPLIDRWMDEDGLTESYLKGRLLELTTAKRTKFFAHKGKVIDEKSIDALDTQIKAVELAMKFRGMFTSDIDLVIGSGSGEAMDTEALAVIFKKHGAKKDE